MENKSFAEKGSVQLTQQAFRPAGGHLVILLFDTSDPARTDVTTESTLAYTVLGKDAKLGDFVAKTSPEDRALYVEWAEKSTTLFKEKKVKVCFLLLFSLSDSD